MQPTDIKNDSDSFKENTATSADITTNVEHEQCLHQSIEKDNNEQVNQNNDTALDSDREPTLDNTLPNLELNTVIDKNTNPDNSLVTTTSDDTHNINEINQNSHSSAIEDDNDDFGSFDEEGNDDDFGSFDDNNEPDDDGFDSFDEPDDINTIQQQQKEQDIPVVVDNTPIFNTLQEALDSWEKLLHQLYDYKPLDSFTGNAPKSIRVYVLEEAPESLHARLTWDSVTRYMDNDTGIPKVRWHQSEIEKLHLIALSCKRSAIPTSPTMLDTSTINNKPDPIDTTTSSNTVIPPNYQSSPISDPNNTTPTSEKRSSVFGLSSLSRYLPHLSKSNLPKSPTSPISPSTSSVHSSSNDWTSTQHTLPPSSPLTPSNSIPRRSNTVSNNTYHHDLSSLQGAINHMNIQPSTPQQAMSTLNAVSTNMRRSNTVAFSSRFKDSAIMGGSSSPPPPASATSSSTAKPRPTSFHSSGQSPLQPQQQQSSNDLFDLTGDLSTILQSPTSPEFNTSFKPLIPTFSSTPLSPTVTNPVRRNMLPASIHSEITKSSTPPSNLSTINDDDFGDFAGEEDLADGDDIFGDFLNNNTNKASPLGISSNNTSTIAPSAADKDDNDPFGLDSVMMMSASHSRSNSTPVFANYSSMISPTSSVLAPTRVMSPTPSMSPVRVMSPTPAMSPMIPAKTMSPSPIIAHSDIFSPTSTTKEHISSPPTAAMDPFDFSNASTYSSVFDMPVTTAAVNDQQQQKIQTAAKKEDEDDNWGDWAF